MKYLINELHRRSLWQALGIYLAGSWLALQVVDVVNQNFGLPDWVPPFALILLVIGLPIVLATAFVQEGMKPGGARGDAPAGSAAAPATEGVAEEAPAFTGDALPAEPAGTHHRLFTWRNALVGGAAAFALLGVLTAGYLAMRTAGIGPAGTLVAKGLLEDRAAVILADLDAEDEQLADAATEALRVDLSQSTVIRLIEPAAVSDVLEMMGRDPGERVTTEVARDVAEREGAAAVISGEINRAGVGYVFSVQMITPADGEVLTSQRETAADSTEVIPAIDQLSSRLRERIGESLKTIRAKPPLDRVTTSNLEALRLYSQTENQNNRRAIALYEQAIALDSGFAMAWRGLAIRLGNTGRERAREVAAYRYAFDNRDRLTERERRLAAASYYNQVTFEIDRAIIEYEALLERDPDDETALNNLGVALGRIGQEERAEALYLRKLELSPDEFAPGYWNAYQTRLNLGNFDGAREILDSARVRFGDGYAWQYAMASAVEGDLDTAESDLQAILSNVEPGAGFSTWLKEDLAAIAAARGRVADARAHLETAISTHEDLGRPAEALEDAVQAAWIELTVRDGTDSALERLDGALERHPLAELQPLDRPYLALVQLYARAGRLDRARTLLTELESEVPEELRKGLTPELLRAEGEIAVAEGRYEDAVRDFRRSFRGDCKLCGMAGLAHAYDRAGQRDSALVAWEKFATTPFADRYAPYVAYTYALGPGIGPAYERVAQLSDEAGDLDKAAEYYARFVELWANADPELQPRVQAAQARLEEIVRERG